MTSPPSFAAEPPDLPLPELRALHARLRREEALVSYWRDLVQGRLDLVRARLDGADAHLASLLEAAARLPRSSPRPGAHHTGALPLEHVEALWETPVQWDDRPALLELRDRLDNAQAALSGQRRDLHRCIDACRAELVARYRGDPAALPGLLGPP